MPASCRSATRIYVGLGAYTTAALYVHFGIGPWLGLPVAIAIAVACGAVIGFLAFRFGVAGVYFAILTIAFAEFARIGFDHFSWVGGSSGFFLPVANYTSNDFWNLRGNPTMFYYVMLALDGGGIRALPCPAQEPRRLLLAGDPRGREAARSLGINTFRYKMIAVVISAGMTAFAGVFFAFYYNNLFPEQVFHISRSIEMILGPDHRRHRHAVRPDRRRVPAHRTCPRSCRSCWTRSASTSPAPSRCSMAYACCWS